MFKKLKRYLFILSCRLHFALNPYKRGFYDGLAISRNDKPYFGK